MSPIQKINPKNYDQASVTAKEMAKLDQIAIEDFGIDLLQMMERAGSHLATLCAQFLGRNGKILVLAGSGHNGGGGLVAAKHLYTKGFRVSVYLTSNNLKPTTNHQLIMLKKLNVKILSELPNLSKFDLLVDALLGYNIKGEVKGLIKSVIEAINSNKVKTISLDLPSGLNPDTGQPNGISVKSYATLTLATPKVGLLKPVSKRYVGKLYLADIGIPKEIFKKL
ncbi:NAD(P)H-hydrate epimerase [Patescibacteria group bacterium]|nr:NAD(P)H-hydrate epimerase [Patescibacteria group bacterium]